MNFNGVNGGNPTTSNLTTKVTGKQHPIPATATGTAQKPPTPADVLVSYGLDPEKARRECDGLGKFLSGQAPATVDFDGMLRWLNTELPVLHDDKQKAKMAAELMVAIQKSHPLFVPVLDVTPLRPEDVSLLRLQNGVLPAGRHRLGLGGLRALD